MKAVLWNKDTEAWEVSSWRMLNHQSFYFHPEYKLVSSGFISSFSLSFSLFLICLSSPSLCLFFSNHSQKLNLHFYSGTVRHTLPTLKLSTCVCDICVLPSFKVQMCTQNLETTEAYLLHLIMKSIIFRVGEQQINVCLLVFYVRWTVVPQWLQRLELSCNL